MSESTATPAEPPGAAPAYDPTTAKIGMWLFLFTELLLFGTLFIALAVYLGEYTWHFQAGSSMLSIPMGALNTVVLLTSSLFMALSIAALQRRNTRLSLKMMDLTLLCSVLFLLIKALEWGAKFEHQIWPGSAYVTEYLPYGEQVFFSLYFTMTGLHALHVVIGMGLILWARARVKKSLVTAQRPVFLENIGLYWHLVDLVWIFLFPMFYLIR